MTAEQIPSASIDAGDKPATMEDYANLSFNALEIDLDKVRDIYRAMWTDIAIALSMLRKTPDEARDVARSLWTTNTEDGECLLDETAGLPRAAKWLRELSSLVESGSIRLTAGASRVLIEEEAKMQERRARRRMRRALASSKQPANRPRRGGRKAAA